MGGAIRFIELNNLKNSYILKNKNQQDGEIIKLDNDGENEFLNNTSILYGNNICSYFNKILISKFDGYQDFYNKLQEVNIIKNLNSGSFFDIFIKILN